MDFLNLNFRLRLAPLAWIYYKNGLFMQNCFSTVRNKGVLSSPIFSK